MRGFWYGIGLLLGFVLLTISNAPSQSIKVVACDVGQGDAILISKGRTQVLIDGGPSGEKILACLETQIPFWDRTIELIVLTNSDFDHMNGLISVVERYIVRHFVTSDGVHKSDSLDRMVEVLGEQSVRVEGVEQGDNIKILTPDRIEFKVLWPPEFKEEYIAVFSDQMSDGEREQILGASAKRGDLNERSVVLLLLEDNKSFLLMGDAGFQTEKELIEQGLLSKVDYLKVGHHGSKYASSIEFLEIVRPKVAVISVGAKNRYGHPTDETLERLARFGATIMRTDRDSSVVYE